MEVHCIAYHTRPWWLNSWLWYKISMFQVVVLVQPFQEAEGWMAHQLKDHTMLYFTPQLWYEFFQNNECPCNELRIFKWPPFFGLIDWIPLIESKIISQRKVSKEYCTGSVAASALQGISAEVSCQYLVVLRWIMLNSACKGGWRW